MQTLNQATRDVFSGICQCKHCGKEFSATASSAEFCCNGCQSVYFIIQANGLSHFYDLKKKGICLTNSRPLQPRPILSDYEFWNEQQNTELEVYIEGIHCSACVWLLEQLPSVMQGKIESSSLDLGKSILSVKLRPEGKPSMVAEQIAKWGYLPHLISSASQAKTLQEKENTLRLTEVGIAGALAGNIMLMSIPLYAGVGGNFQVLFEWISGALAVPALFYSGRSFFKNVKSGIQNKTFPIDAPILLALVIAFFYSCSSLLLRTHDLYFDSLSALIFLLLSSRYYLARLRASSELSLGTLNFFKAASHFTKGSVTTLKANEEIAFDGVIRKGELWVDRSKYTGESLPVLMSAGDTVLAGTTVMSASTNNQIEVIKTGDQTRLAILLKKVEVAQKARTKIELLSDLLAKRLLLVVSTVALVSFVTFIAFGVSGSQSLTRILALLIVTCPCALALATPLVFSLAMKTLLKKGVLVKDPNSLDAILKEKTFYFDKTGTLTIGNLSIVNDLSLLLPNTKSILYSLAMRSQHPVSRAIQVYFSKAATPIPLIAFTACQEKIGVGMFAQDAAHAYSLTQARTPSSHFTEVTLLKDETEIARIQFSDQVKDDSKDLVRKLIQLGYHPAILSGDHEAPAKAIAADLGILEVHAKLSPEQKTEYAKKGTMIGDGFNDALSISSAKVSIAVQGGMEAAVQSSQVYLLKPEMNGILELLKVAKQVRSTLKINFAVSTSYNLIGGILSLAGWMNPLLAAVLMPLSALSVFTFSVWRFKRL